MNFEIIKNNSYWKCTFWWKLQHYILHFPAFLLKHSWNHVWKVTRVQFMSWSFLMTRIWLLQLLSLSKHQWIDADCADSRFKFFLKVNSTVSLPSKWVQIEAFKDIKRKFLESFVNQKFVRPVLIRVLKSRSTRVDFSIQISWFRPLIKEGLSLKTPQLYVAPCLLRRAELLKRLNRDHTPTPLLSIFLCLL